MDLLTIILTAVPAAIAIAAATLAIINSVKLLRLKRMIWIMDDHMYEHCQDICDLMDEVEHIDDYLEETSEKINHNVDMTNITLRNFKHAIEHDRKELKEVREVAELHQDALEIMAKNLELCNENTNDTLDLIEDILLADDIEFEYFEEEEPEKVETPKKKSTKKQK